MINFVRNKRGTGEGNRKVKNWMPLHETIVMKRIQGATCTELAKAYNITEAQVSYICTSWQAKELIARVQENVFQEEYGNFTEERKKLCVAAYKRAKDFVSNDNLSKLSPFGFMDMTLKIAKHYEEPTAAAPVGNTYNVQVNQNRVTVMSDPIQRKALGDGLASMIEVSQQHQEVIGDSVDGTSK